MGKRIQKSRHSSLYYMGLYLYRLLVVLSAIVVVLFCTYQFMKKQPSMAAPQPSSPSVLPSGNPVNGNTPSATPSQTLTRKEKTWTFLLAASDATSGNADTIMVAMYDTVNQKVGLVSIPRDTIYRGTAPNGNHFYKINSAYAYYGADGLRMLFPKCWGFPLTIMFR